MRCSFCSTGYVNTRSNDMTLYKFWVSLVCLFTSINFNITSHHNISTIFNILFTCLTSDLHSERTKVKAFYLNTFTVEKWLLTHGFWNSFMLYFSYWKMLLRREGVKRPLGFFQPIKAQVLGY